MIVIVIFLIKVCGYRLCLSQNADSVSHQSIYCRFPLSHDITFCEIMSCSSLFGLPDELLLIIIDFCNQTEQKVLRLCCRALNIYVVSVLYRTVCLDILPSSVNRVASIADNHKLGLHVKELVISTNLLAPCSLARFERQIRYNEPASLKSIEETIALMIDPTSLETLLGTYSIWKTKHYWLQSRYESYCNYVRYQKYLLQEETRMLHSLILKLAKLQKVTMRKLDDTSTSVAWTAFSKEIFLDAEESFSLHNWTSTTMNGLSVFTHLMLNGGRLGNRLTSLETGFVACEIWQSARIYEAWSSIRILKIHAGCNDTAPARSIVTQGLFMVLRNVPSVMILQISVAPSCGYLSRIDFYRVFSESEQLTNLQQLHLQTGLMTYQNFLSLYRRHRDTLKVFTICDLHLTDGDWQEVLTQLSNDTDKCHFILEALTDGDGRDIRTVIPFCHRIRLSKNIAEMSF